MPPALELLIHISVPSRGSDDARYRKQALGVLRFEAGRRHAVLERDDGRLREQERGGGDGGMVGSRDVRRIGEGLRGEDDEGADGGIFWSLGRGVGSQEARWTGVQEVPATAFPPVERAWTKSTVGATTPRSANLPPVQSSSSALSVPRIHTPPLGLEGAIISQSASRIGVQVILATAVPPVEPAWTSSTVSATSSSAHSRPPQSSPSASPAPRVHIPQTPFPSRPLTAPTAFSNGHSPQLVRPSQSDSWETPPSVVPDSQPSVQFQKDSVPSSEISAPSSSKRISQHSPPSAKRRRRLASPRKEVSSPASESQPSPQRRPPSPLAPPRRSSRSHFQSPSTKRRPTRPTLSTTSTSLPPQPPPSSLPPHPPPPQPTPPPPPRSPPLHPPTSAHHPGPPPTALVPFTTHLTPSLSLIAHQLPLSKFFQPIHTARPLRLLERGCWVLDLSPPRPSAHTSDRVPPGAKPIPGRGTRAEASATSTKDCWRPRFLAYLTHFLASGRAGWGVWLERCSAPGPAPSAPFSPSTSTGYGIVRIYCWGEVVGHVWLLLFLASERKVRGVGARWVDAGGEAVVCMV